MGQRPVAIVIISVLVILHSIFGVPEFFYGTTPLWLRSVAYNFFHANWAHLAVNCIAVWGLYKNPCKPCRDLLFPILIAMAVYPLATMPIVGFSNVIYAAVGLRTPSLRSSWWRRTPVVVFLAASVAMLAVPRISATTHLAAFAAGMILAALRRFYLNITQDARRYLR